MSTEMQLLTVADRRRLANRVQDHLREKAEVRPFPAAVSQLLVASQDPNSTAATFEKIIETDAALAARLLRMANSPLYGIRQEVTSLAHAAAVLGVRQLRSLAFALAGAGMFKEGGTAKGQRSELWNHSLGCAMTCRLLAKAAVGVEPDEAFLGAFFTTLENCSCWTLFPANIRNCRHKYAANCSSKRSGRYSALPTKRSG